MPRPVFVTVISMPTGQDHTGRSTDDSFRLLEQALDWTEKQRSLHGLNAPPPNAFDSIVVAPEYFFIESHPTDRLPMSEVAATQLRSRLAGLSARHPATLMVPGTVLYQERMNAETVVKAKSNALAAEFAARRRAGPAAAGATVKPSDLFGSRAKDTWQVMRSGQPVENIVRVRSIPDTATREYELARLELDDHDDEYWGRKPGLIDIVTGVRPGDTRGLNRAYLMLAGSVQGMYDKHSDYFEVGKAPDRFFFVPGTRENCPETGGFRIGVEICADHRLGVLKRNTSGLDIQIVLSDAIDLCEDNVALRSGGLYINASSNPTYASVRQYRTKGLQRRLTFGNYGIAGTLVNL